jgi:hypothetical protein
MTQSDDASINESNREEKDKHQDERMKVPLIDEPKEQRRMSLRVPFFIETPNRKEGAYIEGRYSKHVMVNDPVQGEDSEDGEDDTETAESDDSEGEEDEDQHDTFMTLHP